MSDQQIRYDARIDPHREELHLHFSGKPTLELRRQLKDKRYGFRWYKAGGFWYAPLSEERRAFAESLRSRFLPWEPEATAATASVPLPAFDARAMLQLAQSNHFIQSQYGPFDPSLPDPEVERLEQLFQELIPDDPELLAAYEEALVPKSPEAEETEEASLLPSYEPTVLNLEARYYSLVKFYLSDDQGQSEFLVFEPSKPKAEAIARQYAREQGRELDGLELYPRNYIRGARVLFDAGHIIYRAAPGANLPASEPPTLVAEEQIAPDPTTPVPDTPKPPALAANEAPAPTKTPIPEVREHKNALHARNEAIRAFIETKDARGEAYDAEDKAFIAAYSGSGGLADRGAEGKGLLYEYYTPEPLVSRMWGLAERYGYEGGDVLEPSCGTGLFLRYAPTSAKVFGIEPNPLSARIAAILYPHVRVQQQAFEQCFYRGNIHLKDQFTQARVDLVIGNPPYGAFTGRWAGMGEKQWTRARSYEEYFVLRGLDLLRPGGLLIYILPHGFLDGDKSKAKQKIASQLSRVVDSYRLPNKLFPSTQIGTDILVLRKKLSA